MKLTVKQLWKLSEVCKRDGRAEALVIASEAERRAKERDADPSS